MVIGGNVLLLHQEKGRGNCPGATELSRDMFGEYVPGKCPD